MYTIQEKAKVRQHINFVITLDNSIKSVEDVERLKMFKLVIAPKNLVLYKEIKSDNSLNNVIYK